MEGDLVNGEWKGKDAGWREGGGEEVGKKRASVPLTSSDVMLMQICSAGCERRRGGEGCRKNETPQH